MLGTGDYSNYTIIRWGELGVVDKDLVPSDLVVPETVNGIQVKSFSFKDCTSRNGWNGFLIEP